MSRYIHARASRTLYSGFETILNGGSDFFVEYFRTYVALPSALHMKDWLKNMEFFFALYNYSILTKREVNCQHCYRHYGNSLSGIYYQNVAIKVTCHSLGPANGV